MEILFKGYNKEKIMKSRGECLTKFQMGKIRQRNRKIAGLKKTGYSYGEIAKQYGLSKEYVKMICHKLGVRGNTLKVKT